MSYDDRQVFAFDCDGTVTKFPIIFRAMGKALKADGHRVIIITGIPLSVFDKERKDKYAVLRDTSWYDEVYTSSDYNQGECLIAQFVKKKLINNELLVGMFKRRICAEQNVAVMFDDKAVIHRHIKGDTPIFCVNQRVK